MIKGRGIPWSDDEINVLRENAGKLSSTDIGKLIDRSKQAVQGKAFRLNITLDGYYKKALCMDCGTEINVSWKVDTTKGVRCPVCRGRYEVQGKNEYDRVHRVEYFNKTAYGNVRNFILERDGYKCRLCGETKHLIVHHINEQSYHSTDNPDNSPDNLTTLCNSCHSGYHAARNRRTIKKGAC
jgi:DNA-directed RNA polymerase subunit RPC12/RpoP